MQHGRIISNCVAWASLVAEQGLLATWASVVAAPLADDFLNVFSQADIVKLVTFTSFSYSAAELEALLGAVCAPRAP